MTTETPIREYQQAVYIYWLGRELGTVKIGHTNNPDRRLREFANETGTPGHRASFAAVVWLDRRREEVELAVHRRLADKRRDGEWFAITPEQALEAILLEVNQRGIRYEVEDFADITGALTRAEEERVAAQWAAEQERAAAQRAAAQEHHRRVQLIQAQQAASEAEAAANKQREFAEAAEADRIEAEADLVRANIEKDRAAAANVAAREGVLEQARIRVKIREENRRWYFIWGGSATLVCASIVGYLVLNHEPLSADKQVQARIATLESSLVESQKRESRLATEVGALKVVHENQRKELTKVGEELAAAKVAPAKVVTVVKHAPAREEKVAEAKSAVEKAEATCMKVYGDTHFCGVWGGPAHRTLESAKARYAAVLNSK